jgi:hypothetical protein
MRSKPKIRYTVDWKDKGAIRWNEGMMLYSKYKARRIVQYNKRLLGNQVRYRVRVVEQGK